MDNSAHLGLRHSLDKFLFVHQPVAVKCGVYRGRLSSKTGPGLMLLQKPSFWGIILGDYQDAPEQHRRGVKFTSPSTDGMCTCPRRYAALSIHKDPPAAGYGISFFTALTAISGTNTAPATFLSQDLNCVSTHACETRMISAGKSCLSCFFPRTTTTTAGWKSQPPGRCCPTQRLGGIKGAAHYFY